MLKFSTYSNNEKETKEQKLLIVTLFIDFITFLVVHSDSKICYRGTSP